MARKTNAALAFALSAALALGTIPAPALAEMAEEAMGAEPVAAQTAPAKSASSQEQPMGVEGAVTSPQPGQLVEGLEEMAPSPELSAEEPLDAGDSRVLTSQVEEPSSLEAQATAVLNPRVTTDSSMASGQVVTWDCVWFGSYPQTEIESGDAAYAKLQRAAWDANNDATVDGIRYRRLSRQDVTDARNWSDSSPEWRYFRYDRIKWRVLRVDNGTALVLADIGVDCRQYDDVGTEFSGAAEVTWSVSTIRSWLNGYGASANDRGKDYSSLGFLSSAFTPAERDAVLETEVVVRLGGTNSYCGPNTRDRVYLLSDTEAYGADAMQFGFVEPSDVVDEARRAKASSFARAMGAATYEGDPYNAMCFWQLRSPGVHWGGSCDVVGASGSVNYLNSLAIRNLAVRPAMTVNLSSAYVLPAGTVSSNGTVSESATTSAPTSLNGVDWSAVYDPEWYAERNPDVANWAKGADGAIDGNKLLTHFVNSGRKEGRSSKQGFELASYYNANADLRKAFGNDWARYYDHYRANGQREGRACSGVTALRGHVTSRDGVDWAPVYDGAYYERRNPDVAGWATRRFASGSVVDDAALLQHFVNSGTKECRASKAGFDVRSYYNANPDLRAAFGGSADWTRYYRHYATNGSRENRKCAGADQLQGTVTKLSGTDWSPVYDRAYYGQRNSDIVKWATRKCGSATVLDDYAMLSHFVNNGRKEGRASKQSFELASYYNANADLRRAFGTDWARYYDHYRANGQREGRAAAGVGQLRGAPTSAEGVDWAPVYDASYYAQRNADVANWARRSFSSGSVLDDVALLSHFVNSGTKEARASKQSFDVRAYKGKNADLARAFGSDWKSYYRHYAKFGVNERRPCV